MNPTHKNVPLLLNLFLLLILVLGGCNQKEAPAKNRFSKYHKGEYIYRTHTEYRFIPPAPKLQSQTAYPWELGMIDNIPKITKEFFRCKGSTLNPVHLVQEKEELVRYFDCGGSEKHSLPLRHKKEFIYPILIDLTNYIQAKTKKRLVITSGYRCPEHNTYVDASASNRYSKHMIGAEVSFYVQGMEEQPDKIINLIKEYYTTSTLPLYKDQKDFTEFKRYEKGDVDVSTQPWYNKEIFIKLYKKKEGRNFDNRHPYPYLSIQVRLDTETQEKVSYSWEKAFNNYLRH